MEEFEEFSVIFGGDDDLSYDHKTIEKIAKNRRLLDNTLFFDRLLGALGISNGAPTRIDKSCLILTLSSFSPVSTQV